MQKIFIIIALFIFIACVDYLWIGLIANSFYLQAFTGFGRITNGNFAPILWAAVMVYFILTIAIYFFIVAMPLSFHQTMVKGALLGFCLYGIYDFTNLATIQNWTLQLTLIDLAWGTFLCALSSAFGRLLTMFMRVTF